MTNLTWGFCRGLSERRILPTLRYIQTAIQGEIGYTGSKSILRKYMRKLGFTYKKNETNCKLLMERGDVVLSRIQYLRKIRQLQEAGCNIVYTDETYVHSNHTVSKTWQDGDIGANVPFSRVKMRLSCVFVYLHFVLQCRPLPEKDKLLCLFQVKVYTAKQRVSKKQSKHERRQLRCHAFWCKLTPVFLLNNLRPSLYQ